MTDLPPPPPPEEDDDDVGEDVAPEEEPEEEAPAADEGNLPPGWIKVWEETHECYYYFNEESGESSWEPPTA
jgi:hypothetical protein